MTAKKAEELAKKLQSCTEHEATLLLLNIYLESWKEGYQKAEDTYNRTLKEIKRKTQCH